MAMTLARPIPAAGLAGALARLAQGRDPEAWQRLTELAGADIRRVASAMTGDAGLAHDAVQECLLTLRDHAGKFRVHGDDADAAARRWITRVAANTSLE